MAFTKTRIWRGGVAGVTPDSRPASEEEAPEPLPFSDTLHGNFSSAEREDLERAAERVTGAFLPGFQSAKPTPLSATRFMPIEQLFPEQHEQATRAHALTPAPAPQPAWRGRVRDLFARGTTARGQRFAQPSARRRLRLGLGALLLVGLAAALLVPMLRARSRMPEHTAEASALEPESGAQAAAAERELPAPARDLVKEGAAQRTPGTKPAGLERSAIDALISGDLARATELYQRLSQSAPDERVYREALRIVRDRSRAR